MQAIILAGGRGERLRPYTDDRPKPMVKVNGMPLIAYQLGWLKKNGITDVVLSCGYRWDVLQDYLGDGSGWGIDICYAVEKEKLGRGGGIRFAMQYLKPGSDPIVVANGDNMIDIDLAPVLEQHEQRKRLPRCAVGAVNSTAFHRLSPPFTAAMVTCILTPLVSSRGIVEVDDRDRIVRFREKPELPHWINAGIYVFARQVADLLPLKGDHEDMLFPSLAAQGQLYAYKTRELWRTVDTAKDIAEITRELEAGLNIPCLALNPDR